MNNYKNFEDMEIWKCGRKLFNKIYDITDKKIFAKDFSLKNQMRAAVISITSNISEGFERDGDNDHTRFLSYSKGSAGEVRSQLYLALDRGYIDEKEFAEIKDLLLYESKMIGGFIKYLRKSGYSGTKRKKEDGSE